MHFSVTPAIVALSLLIATTAAVPLNVPKDLLPHLTSRTDTQFSGKEGDVYFSSTPTDASETQQATTDPAVVSPVIETDREAKDDIDESVHVKRGFWKHLGCDIGVIGDGMSTDPYKQDDSFKYCTKNGQEVPAGVDD